MKKPFTEMLITYQLTTGYSSHHGRPAYLPPILGDGFAVHAPPKTEDHRQLSIATVNDVKTMLEDALEVGHGFFRPGIIFNWIDFKQHVEKMCKENRLKTADVSALFEELGGSRDRVTIDGQKLSRAWFAAGNEGLRALFKVNTKVGRTALKQRLYVPSCSLWL